MDRFLPFKDQRDKFLSMYVVVIHNLTGQEVIDALYSELEALKKIKDTYKRGYVNDRIFSLVTEFKSNRKTEDVINEVILLGSVIENFSLTAEEKAVLEDFHVPSFVMRHGEYFDLDFLQDLLYNTDFDEVIKVRNNRLTHFQMTPTKQRVVGRLEEKPLDVEKYVKENVNRPALIHGVSSALKGLKFGQHTIVGRELSEEQVWRELTRLRMIERLSQLHDVFETFSNPTTQHKIVVGKPLRESIKTHQVERIVATSEVANKIREKFKKYLNFQLIEVVDIDNNADVKRLEADFGGAIGVKYF